MNGQMSPDPWDSLRLHTLACLPAHRTAEVQQGKPVEATQEDPPAQGPLTPLHWSLGIRLRHGLYTLPPSCFSTPPGSEHTFKVYPCA